MDNYIDRLSAGLDKLEACDSGLFEQTKAQIIDIVKSIEDIVGVDEDES